MESTIIHCDTSDQEWDWGLLGHEAADAIDALVILMARTHGRSGHADEEEALLGDGDDAANALDSGWNSVDERQTEAVYHALADYGRDGAPVKLCHHFTLSVGSGACGGQTVEAEVGFAWGKIVCAWLDDDFVS